MLDSPVVIGLIVLVLLILIGGWIDLAFLGIAVRLWGFGRERTTPRSNEKIVLRKRFGRGGPLIGWIMSPYEVIVTGRRFIVNYRNAFTRLDIPLEDVKSITVRPRPWPMSDDLLISYLDSGTSKQFLLPENSTRVIDALKKAGADFSVS